MGKRSVIVWNNRKSQRSILHYPRYNLLETSKNKGKEGLTKLYRTFAEIFKESDRVHACPAVATRQQREEWTNQTCGVVVTDTEDINSDDGDRFTPPLIYQEDSNDEENNPCESPINPSSAETTPEPGHPKEKPTEEPTP